MNAEMLRFKVAMQAGLAPPPEIASKICRAIDSFENGDYKSLCAALGWRRKAGERKSKTNNDISARNHYLHRCILEYGGITFANCEKLAIEIQRWQSTTHRMIKLNPNYPLSKIQNLISCAESYGDLPATEQGIYKALTK
jgi:hypothetical protein